jgi:dihydropteroate synthase
VISLSSLAELAHAYREDLDLPVTPLRLGRRLLDLDAQPAVMGCINLSRESTYRDSIAVATESAVRRGRILHAQGAALVDIGAESSTPRAARVDPEDQIAALVPIVGELSAEGVTVSVETHHPDVARACLKAGASMLNYSGGTPYDEAIFDVVADLDAAIVLCHVPGTDVRDIQDAGDGADPIPMLLDHFTRRLDVARAHGVENIAIDPGIGFSFGPPTTPAARVDRQTRTLLHTFRLRRLGLPVCQALPHAFDLFEDQFRTAEAFFAVLAHLGGCNIYRTHEVARVIPVLTALQGLSTQAKK